MSAQKVAVRKRERAAKQPKPPPTTRSPASAGPDSGVRQRLLRMADAYRAAGAVHHATEMYFELAEEHDGTAEADHARARLMELAEEYELAAQLHRARSIYERLL